MNLRSKLVSGIGALILATSAQAGLIVRSIDMAVVDTKFDSTSLPGWMSDESAALLSYLVGFLPAYNNPDTLLCDISVDAFDGLSAGTCGGGSQNHGTLYTVSGTATGPVELEFGLDWGRGGFTLLALDGMAPQLERHKSDIWWNRDWNHSDVLDFLIPQSGDFLFLGLGFEGCCDGINSARWRPVGGNNYSASLVGGPGQWQTLAVNNVPEPGAAYLLAIGLAGFVVTRRRRVGAAQ